MILDIPNFFRRDEKPLSSDYEEDMTKSSISTSYSGDSSLVVTKKKDAKHNHNAALSEIACVNNEDAIIVSHLSSDQSECYEVEYFYDTLAKLDISNLPILQVENSTQKSSGLFCCFCPPICDGSNDSDSEDGLNPDFLDGFHQLQIDDESVYLSGLEGRGRSTDRFGRNSLLLADNEDEEFLHSEIGSTTTSIDIDEYISCCDSEEFFQDQMYSPIITDLSKESDATMQRENTSPKFLRPEDDFLLQDDSALSRQAEISAATVSFSGSIRIGDLNVYDNYSASSQKSHNQDENIEIVLSPSSNEGATQGTKLDFLELTNMNSDSSQELQHHTPVINVMNAMTEMGLNLAIVDNNEQDDKSSRVCWTEVGATGKSIKKILSDNHDSKWHTNPDSVQLLEEEVLTWSGSMSGSGKYGSKIPLFRGRGIIPSLSPLQLAELILDSSKVKLYNKFTNGRDDLCVLQHGLDIVGGPYGDGCLKVVESKTNVPLSSKTLSMINVLHARPIAMHSDELNAGVKDEENETNANECNPNGFVIVSRTAFMGDDSIEEQGKNVTEAVVGSKNELIWGVNILREVPGEPNKTDLTTVSQANSSAIPSFLSHKVGMIGIREFFKNLRAAKP